MFQFSNMAAGIQIFELAQQPTEIYPRWGTKLLAPDNDKAGLAIAGRLNTPARIQQFLDAAGNRRAQKLCRSIFAALARKIPNSHKVNRTR
jgi:hypothetical protein